MRKIKLKMKQEARAKAYNKVGEMLSEIRSQPKTNLKPKVGEKERDL